MANSGAQPPNLQVIRYREAGADLQIIVGGDDLPLSEAALIAWARDALERQTFVCHTVPMEASAHSRELCFVPRQGSCEILSIHADQRRRHHGDHRRSLMEILNDLAAAVACGRLCFLDDRELAAELTHGSPLMEQILRDAATIADARLAVAKALDQLGFTPERRDETVLCLSEAATNAVVHGGGAGRLTLLEHDGHARLVVADRGPGLRFMNWLQASDGAQASMGYGYHIILEHIDDVALNTGPNGTTLILDQQPRRPEVMSSC